MLAEPGLRPLLVMGLLAKTPGLGISAVIVLHVVSGLDRGYGAAGLAAAAWTAGAGVGAPFQGRALDRYGLRPVFAVLLVAQALFWGLAHLLPFPALLPAAFLGGLTAIPAFTVVRLALATMVAAENRHTAYVMDSMTTDIAYMVGPSVGILLAAQVSPTAAFLVMGGLMVLSGLGYVALDPPLRAARQPGRAPRPRDWLTLGVLAALGATVGNALVIVGFEVTAIGALQRWGDLTWSWLLLVAAGLASVAGGLVYGALKRPPAAYVLTACLGVLCLPLALAGSWPWLCLLAVPVNLFVAPALSSTATAISTLAPDGARGVAMGAYSSALLVGNVAGSPLAGLALDRSGPPAAFVTIAAVTLVIAAATHVIASRARPAPAPAARP
ncbi:MFS transporter [Bailinhaonella thermotolerans]|uniref:MFS transporter n=1 Tax=Bailinhaonella thermotolerans TaxID=1070861 RepID=A0A3A4A4D2_9ACTN|nr:MFS transporter [Bailinhaonella thermotolerans]